MFSSVQKIHLQQPQTKAVQSCSVRHNWRGKAVKAAPPPQRDSEGLEVARGKAAGVVSVYLLCSLPVAPLVSISPHRFSSVPLRPQNGGEALPQVALVLGVHGGACLAAKVLWEVARVRYGADDSEPGRAVRIRDDALVRAFRRPGGAPYLQQGLSGISDFQA